MVHASFPEEVHVSSAGILRFLNDAQKEGLNFHGVRVVRHGKVACDMAWKPYQSNQPHMLFSLSKSFTSMAAGFAVQEGLIRYDDPILQYLGKDAPEHPSERQQKITISHLLMMGSGLDYDADKLDPNETHWARAAMRFPVDHEPGTHFHYNSLGTYLVSYIVQKVTGMPIVEYLTPRLFDKLGIKRPRWNSSPEGVNLGGWGLYLSTEEIAKAGQLLLQNGMWEGERVLPDFFVDVATQKHINNWEGEQNPASDWQQGYGYQFWRCVDGYYRGDGMSGQLMIVIPQKDAVVAVTACIDDMQREMTLIRDTIIAAMLPDDEPCPRTADTDALLARLPELALPTYEGDDGSMVLPEGLYRDEKGNYLSVAKPGKGLVLQFFGEPWTPPYGFCYGMAGQQVQTCLPYDGHGIPLEYQATYAIKNGKLTARMDVARCPATRVDELTLTADGLTDVVTGTGFPTGTYQFKKV